MEENHQKYLKLLSKRFPTEQSAATEIINLQAILALPKGTEHFLTDIHGEDEQFLHVLKNGSGTVRRKVEAVIGSKKDDAYKKMLTTLIYYPKEKLELLKESVEADDWDDWCMETLQYLVDVVKRVSSKYTRSKVRRAIPEEYRYVVEELITEKEEIYDKERYYEEILRSIVDVGVADSVIITLCNLIQRLVVDHLHIVGDIYDRGPGPHIIMDKLCEYHSVDVVWGNHDVVWMGAACGNPACIANVIRMSVRYGNLGVIEDGYGINLLPLAAFAMKQYENVDLSGFHLKENNRGEFFDLAKIESQMYKAITMIQFKVEGQIIGRNPDFEMDNQRLLDKIDYTKKTVRIEGVEYPLLDCDFPTVNPEDPYELSPEEDQVMKQLIYGFTNSEKLKNHIRLLYEKGSLYRIYNGNLLYHGCVPLNEDATFKHSMVGGKETCGRAMYDMLEDYARKAFYAPVGSPERTKGGDILWYLWCGPKSPSYGRSKMTTFERLFIEEKETHAEKKDAYYRYIENDEKVASDILKEFGLTGVHSHIINGHVPVETKKGQTPIRAGGKVLMIDGGFSKAYHAKTGIAGYTLAIDSHGMWLVEHEQFESKDDAIRRETDIVSDTLTVENFEKRMYVEDTDVGKGLKEEIRDLTDLLNAYRNGIIEPKG
ncbi:MAG: fructose-1,6-bisphosphatase [Lachnospiraceae bacterium]|nr:fructose-1,6-bisphosphatase [Lachnospiraceae bacterium]